MFLSPKQKIAAITFATIAASALPAGNALAYLDPFAVFTNGGPTISANSATTITGNTVNSTLGATQVSKTIRPPHRPGIDKHFYNR